MSRTDNRKGGFNQYMGSGPKKDTSKSRLISKDQQQAIARSAKNPSLYKKLQAAKAEYAKIKAKKYKSNVAEIQREIDLADSIAEMEKEFE